MRPLVDRDAARAATADEGAARAGAEVKGTVGPGIKAVGARRIALGDDARVAGGARAVGSLRIDPHRNGDLRGHAQAGTVRDLHVIIDPVELKGLAEFAVGPGGAIHQAAVVALA